MARRYSLYIFTLSLWILFQASIQLSLPQVIIDEVSTREFRHHHYIWHQIRNLWDRFDNATQTKITNLGWAPPRPALRYEDGNSIPIEDNDSGEDFLYMHREMIIYVNNTIESQKNPPRLTRWESIPPRNDSYFRLPANYTGPSTSLTELIARYKSDDFYENTIKPREARFKDPSYLRTLTLGQLGSKIEFTIHSWLHTRFSSSSSVGYRARLSSDPLPDIDERWDSPDYKWLIDSYASPVDPYFWKIHMWVDDRINDWMDANGVKELVWKGNWTGGPMSKVDDLVEVGEDVKVRTLAEVETGQDHSSMGGMMGCGQSQNGTLVLTELMEVLLATGMESQFYDAVVFEEDLPLSRRRGVGNLRRG